MASIGPVLLDIDPIPNNLDAEVDVTYTITFDASDLSTNRRYTERVELIGVDDGFLNTRDEPIRFGVGEVPFFEGAIRADGRATARVVRSRRVQRRDLNEDRPGLDEVRARVSLKPATGAAVARDSNLVKGDFNPSHV